MLQMHRKRGEVGIRTGQHHLLHRRLGARELDDVGLAAQATLDLRKERVGCDAEGPRDTRARSGDVADKLLPLRPGGAKPYGPAVALENIGDVGEVDWRIACLQLVRPTALDETTQPAT